MPTGYRFDRGHRIRLVITHADADNALVVPQTPRPEVKVFFGGEHASEVSLPVLPG